MSAMRENSYRVESDFLGEKQIPSHAYYGVQTVRAHENFQVTGQTIDPHVIQAFGMIKKSAAQANMEIGMLDETIARAIMQAGEEVMFGKFDDQFILDPIQGGAGTSSNMNANEVIANRALEFINHEKGDYAVISPTTHVNMAQSTNDVFPTANRLAMLALIDTLQDEMEKMYTTYLDKAEEFKPLLKMGRTHLQDAVPIRLGQEFEAYAHALKRDMQRLADAKKYLYEVNLGGTAVGTGLNADPAYIEKVVTYLGEESGYPLRSAAHLIDATQNTDAYTTLSAVLKITMVNMSKVANDLRLMSSGPKVGLGEITLPPRQAGSSIMPGKVNPVIAEFMSQIAFQVIGNDQTVTAASEAGQFELNVMEPVLVHNVIESLNVMIKGIEAFRDYCVQGIQANTAQLNDNINKSLGIITAINPHIGYEAATEIAQEAFRTGKTIRDICLERGLLTEEELEAILSPAEMTQPGISAAHLLKQKEIVK